MDASIYSLILLQMSFSLASGESTTPSPVGTTPRVAEVIITLPRSPPGEEGEVIRYTLDGDVVFFVAT